jgi:hypothetical protein
VLFEKVIAVFRTTIQSPQIQNAALQIVKVAGALGFIGLIIAKISLYD